MGFAALLVCIAGLLSVPGVAAGAQYDIGPGHGYERPADFPWDNLGPGDVVRIHWRREPYREKLVLRRSGAKDRPIVIRGIPGPSKELPVIEGAGAVQFQEMQSPRKAGRGLIIIGDREPANHIVIERLEIRGANNTEKFVWGNATIPYENNAAGVFVDKGTGITVRQCSIHSCCMGVITAYYPDVGDFVLHGNHIHNNGDFTGERWGHNVYLCANRTWVQFNRFGEMRSDGNNIKDRSGRTIIRYNWIEGGLSRQIDMVESNRYPRADAYVYGNVIAQGGRVLNPKMILFGGDVGGSRRGTLYFFNNTVHARSGRLDAFLWLNQPDCQAIVQNNFFIGNENLSMGVGTITGSNNMFPYGTDTTGFQDSFFGGDEQCMPQGGVRYMPHPHSFLVDRGTAGIPTAVKYMPMPYGGGRKRPFDGRLDIGAFELPKRR